MMLSQQCDDLNVILDIMNRGVLLEESNSIDETLVSCKITKDVLILNHPLKVLLLRCVSVNRTEEAY